MDQPLEPTAKSPAPTLAPLWLRALGFLIEPWIRIRREPAEPRTQYDPALPVCYVTERYGLSDTLILEQACREAGLPEPLRPFTFGGMSKQRAMLKAVVGRALKGDMRAASLLISVCERSINAEESEPLLTAVSVESLDRRLSELIERNRI